MAIVIGAGPAGLAAAAELQRAGVPATVVERTTAVGSAWRSRYDRLRLNTSRFTSRLSGVPYPRGTPLFPSRDQFVGYLERYASRERLDIRFGTAVEHVRCEAPGWRLVTTGGELHGTHVVVATGYAHTPFVPAWPGRARFQGALIHAADYRCAQRFSGRDVLVVGAGCSGMEIAYDLVAGGAARVRLSVRTPPNIVLRSVGGVPGDLPGVAMLKLPASFTDRQGRVLRRVTLGDLAPFGLPTPPEGAFSRLARTGAGPAVVDRAVVRAIRDGRIEVIDGIRALGTTDVELTGGGRIEPDEIVAATGYRTGLEPLFGHLGVLGERGVPRVAAGREAAPGLRFVGYDPIPGQIRRFGVEARRAAAGVARATTDRAR